MPWMPWQRMSPTWPVDTPIDTMVGLCICWSGSANNAEQVDCRGIMWMGTTCWCSELVLADDWLSGLFDIVSL